ncbi:hypothetical protein [Marinibactrum halimedae]|uniref:DUF4878 domain-containing protein n=1 Tax=Marinibactrum halimedae TaxID=1444977 RepID=A0AA37T1B8_9GAMM|nr:hypothetical protein [Marinibactrum halimedae]MCD9460734.1 hypothetical protein [Marinibactrum halimedae]GLS25140.1 hypothetical protein GCM10007877_08540 [Marinibactrum halimedae]
MNIILKFSLIFLILISLVSCSKTEADPETIYKDYLASIQAMNSMSENDYQSFISSRAKAVVNDKIDAVNEDQLERFLTLFKAEAVLPEHSRVSLNSVNQDSPVLEILIENYPEKGSSQKQNVRFVQEHGWKIDKIEVTTSGEDFEFKSTTY